MKIVIDIPQGLKIDFENENWTALTCMEMKDALMNGTPLDKVFEDIKADIEKAMEDFYYDEHDLGVRAGFRFALEIIDNHINGKEQE